MSDKFLEREEDLEAVLREIRGARSLAAEREYQEPVDCIEFTRLMRIAQQDVKATAEEAEHLSGCNRCHRFMALAEDYLPVLKPMPQVVARPLFDRLIDGFHRAHEWVDKATDFRRSVPCTFTFASAGGYVMGEPTTTYTCNLMYLLEELGVADSFETFKLVCETGNGTTVSAVLIPRPPVSEQSGIEVMLYLSAPQQPQERSTKRGGTPRPLILHLKPFEHVTSTPKLEFSMMRDPTTFAGSLEIRIQEAVAPPEEE